MSTNRSTQISETSPAAASTVVGETVAGMDRFDAWALYATLAGATGGTLDVYLQSSFDNGTTWYDFAHFAQLTAAAAAKTFYVSSTQQVSATGAIQVGMGTTGSPSVALAADTYVRGPIGNLIRAVYVAGSGTSAGAAVLIDFVGFITSP
jgi:hypothetical protein